MYELKLDPATWDLSLDSAGHIATTDGDYATAQAVANRVKLFTDDSIYEPSRGIPHFVTSLGAAVSEAVIRARCNAAALEVDGVESATTEIEELDGRTLHCNIEIELTDGGGLSVDI